jgi:hypothetical protein
MAAFSCWVILRAETASTSMSLCARRPPRTAEPCRYAPISSRPRTSCRVARTSAICSRSVSCKARGSGTEPTAVIIALSLGTTRGRTERSAVDCPEVAVRAGEAWQQRETALADCHPR